MEINTLSSILLPWLLVAVGAGVVGVFHKQLRMTAAAVAEEKHTEQLLEESELRFRILTRATNEAVWDWDITSDSVWWNRNVQTLLGYGEEEIVPTSAWRMQNVHPDDRKRVEDGLRARVRGEKEDFWSGEYRFRRADGSYADIFDRGYILRDHDGRAIRMIGSMLDMTKRKREMELARARDAALESARLKSQFLANMSHEIRTPMNSIIGMTDILLHLELTSEQREFVEIVRMSGESLLTIINDILDFSKIEAGKLTFEMLDFEPRTAVEEVIAMLVEQTHAKKLELRSVIAPEVPGAVRGDPGRLRQVLTNLTSNAIKFTPQGEIKISVTKESESDAHVILRFEVADTGIGVPEEARACLFQPFSQVDPSTTRKYGGTGLGLAICKQLVNLMAGQIGCESVPNRGSTFWFTAQFEKLNSTALLLENLPEITSTTAELPAQQLPEKARKRLRILVAEDNAFNQKVVLRQVREMGFGADAVANGIEALEALNRIHYDLVLMDCQMPEMDGYACAAEIRRQEDNAGHIPIIAMTAHVMKEDRDKCLAAGMDDFLSKPVRVVHLECVLTQWLTGSTTATASEMPNVASRSREDPREGDGPHRSQVDPPSVDLETFMEIAGNDEQRLRELADRYLRQTTEQLARLREAIATGTAPDIKRIAHSAAGSSAMCGMKPLVGLLRELERMGQAGQLADTPRVYGQVTEEFSRIEHFLREHSETEVNLKA
ncbi:MAG TPA: ATP-binding protein [Verrucomicrobiae bacterium]|nr:ATP-binding protein [Verrucomicrobiae bacterium]